tara:strand:- start:34 stop:249 length:216 start_codon:yes stop_codon:yes gene_type:complete
MTISIEQLNEEKALLQADFDKINSQINKVTNDLAQMKANLNALNGAIQQVNKLIDIANVDTPKAKKLKESI